MKCFLLFFALLPTLLLAKPDPEKYLNWHEQCLEGDTDTIDARIADFEARIATDSADYLAQAYLGSANALRARESFWGPTKLKFLKRGRALLDSAVKAAPANPRVRMVRAIGYFRIPKRFGVRATSLKDFDVLIPLAKKSGKILRANERQAILYYAYLANKEAGNAQAAELKKACHEISTISWYGKKTA